MQLSLAGDTVFKSANYSALCPGLRTTGGKAFLTGRVSNKYFCKSFSNAKVFMYFHAGL